MAIPGLVAKPIIDIMAAVASLDGLDLSIGRLCDNGYPTSPAFNASLSDRKWLMPWRAGGRAHHLHIVAAAGPQRNDWLAFRDASRRDLLLTGRYVELKAEWATRHRADREAYSAAKTAFVDAVVAARRPG